MGVISGYIERPRSGSEFRIFLGVSPAVIRDHFVLSQMDRKEGCITAQEEVTAALVVRTQGIEYLHFHHRFRLKVKLLNRLDRVLLIDIEMPPDDFAFCQTDFSGSEIGEGGICRRIDITQQP